MPRPARMKTPRPWDCADLGVDSSWRWLVHSRDLRWLRTQATLAPAGLSAPSRADLRLQDPPRTSSWSAQPLRAMSRVVQQCPGHAEARRRALSRLVGWLLLGATEAIPGSVPIDSKSIEALRTGQDICGADGHRLSCLRATPCATTSMRLSPVLIPITSGCPATTRRRQALLWPSGRFFRCQRCRTQMRVP